MLQTMMINEKHLQELKQETREQGKAFQNKTGTGYAQRMIIIIIISK